MLLLEAIVNVNWLSAGGLFHSITYGRKNAFHRLDLTALGLF
jgi:hypothetical protein